MMMISKVLVAMLAVSAMAMAFLQNVEGGRDMAMKEAKAQNPQIFTENLGYTKYKPKEDYDCDGDKYKYKDRDCYEYGDCDKSPYPYHYHEDDDHKYNWNSYKKQALESKEAAGKYGVHQNFP